MRFLSNIKIGLRLNLIMSLIMVIIISSLGIYTIKTQKAKIIADTDLRMFEQVNDLSNTIKVQLHERQSKVNYALITAREVLKYNGKPTIGDRNQNVLAINQVTKSTQNITISNLKIANKDVYRNFIIVDKIQEMTGATATIFQKIPEGYLRISTNVLKENGERAVGTYIPNSSLVIQTIESGNTYYGRAFVVNDYYLTAYEPIFINGKVQGILYVGLKETDISNLKTVFKEKKYFESGYPFMIDKKGTFIIHPNNEGENHYNAEFFQQLINSNKSTGKTNYLWEGKSKFQYFKYIEQLEAYVSVSIYENELMGIINHLRNAIIISIIFGIIIYIIVNIQVSRSITRALNKGVAFAEKIASGNLSTNIDINQKDEIGLLAVSLNKMAENLRIEQYKYKTLFETANDGIFILDKDNKFIDCNTKSLQLYDCSKKQLISITPVEVSPKYQPNGERSLELAIKKIQLARRGTPQRFEWLHTTFNGEKAFFAEISLNRTIISDEEYLVAIVRDISLRKKAESALRESEAKYRTLLENMNDIVMLVDNDDRVLYVNSRFTEKLGYIEDEIIGEIGYEKLLIPEDHIIIKKANLDRTKNIRYQYEATFISKSGKKFDFLVSGAPVRNSEGEIIGSIGNMTDITERKKIEKALKESEEKYRLLVENGPSVFWITDKNGRTKFISSNVSKIFGFTPDEIYTNGTKAWLDRIHKQDIENVLTNFKSVFTGNKRFDITYRIKNKKGKWIWLQDVGEKYINDIGEELAYGVFTDITEKKYAQQKVYHAMLNAEERERCRVAKELHDGISPILSAIKLYAQTLLNVKDENVKKEISGKIEYTINEAIQSINDISNNLSPHILQNFGLSVAIQSFIDKISETTKINFSFSSNIDENLEENIKITLYRTSVELINNTLKYANAKNVKIKISGSKDNIKLNFEHNGKGFNLDEVLQKSKGMGLYNIYNRVNSINGEFNINTSLDTGLTVDISIPFEG